MWHCTREHIQKKQHFHVMMPIVKLFIRMNGWPQKKIDPPSKKSNWSRKNCPCQSCIQHLNYPTFESFFYEYYVWGVSRLLGYTYSSKSRKVHVNYTIQMPKICHFWPKQGLKYPKFPYFSYCSCKQMYKDTFGTVTC